jgi:hypothetical protein
MGGLKVGWDTVDELLSTFYGWKVLTIDTNCQAFKTNRANYNKTARYKQGEAFTP